MYKWVYKGSENWVHGVILESTTPIGIKLVCWVREKRLEDLKAIAILTQAFTIKKVTHYIRDEDYRMDVLYGNGHYRQTNKYKVLGFISNITDIHHDLVQPKIPKPSPQLEIPNLFNFE